MNKNINEEELLEKAKELKEYLDWYNTNNKIYSEKLDTYIYIINSSNGIIGGLYIENNGDLFSISDFEDEYDFYLCGNGMFNIVDKDFNLIDDGNKVNELFEK